jgi:hypothetical protein
MKLKTGLTLALLGGAGVLLASCADERALDAQYSSLHMGQAYREDMAAQIADPDVAYKGPPPPSSGERAQAATDRYKNDKVIQPYAPSSLTQISGGGGGGGPQ